MKTSMEVKQFSPDSNQGGNLEKIEPQVITVVVENIGAPYSSSLDSKSRSSIQRILPYYAPKHRGNIGGNQFYYTAKKIYIGISKGEKDALTFDSIDQIEDLELKAACLSNDRLVSEYNTESKEDSWEENRILRATLRSKDEDFEIYNRYKDAGKNVLYKCSDGYTRPSDNKYILGFLFKDGIETILSTSEEVEKAKEEFIKS